MIQLNQMDKHFENIGGLYVKPEDISAVYAQKVSYNKNDKGYRPFIAVVVLNCGKEFEVMQTVEELLEQIKSSGWA